MNIDSRIVHTKKRNPQGGAVPVPVVTDPLSGAAFVDLQQVADAFQGLGRRVTDLEKVLRDPRRDPIGDTFAAASSPPTSRGRGRGGRGRGRPAAGGAGDEPATSGPDKNF